MYRDGELRVRSTDPSAVAPQVTVGLASIINDTDLRYQPAPPGPPPASSPRRAPQVGEVALRSDRRIPLRQGSFVISQSGVIYQFRTACSARAKSRKRSIDEMRALPRRRH